MAETFMITQLLIKSESMMKLILKIATGQGDDYTAGCLLDYQPIAVDLSKQEELDADPRATH